ncbi:hypothetical protein GGQ55_001580 [Geodermatophilus daqingensis]|uniref:Uncharacterized protein n=1 Tax=Petropleomorpha daqingensis TaxID=2026353 RepID=A0A853CFF2_9ACTN|nr:hypothetical protein [Petropleomorpha daqingensis]
MAPLSPDDVGEVAVLGRASVAAPEAPSLR